MQDWLIALCFFGPFLFVFLGGIAGGASIYARFKPALPTLGVIGLLLSLLSGGLLFAIKVHSQWILAQVMAAKPPFDALWFTGPLALTLLPVLIALGMALRMRGERSGGQNTPD